MSHPVSYSPIGVFDSGFGGLTVLREFIQTLPAYDYIYLGDNARAPYGTRSFDTVYHYTLECVRQLFAMDCRLVILACNTASAKALRTIQQRDLQLIGADRRVLGVIRPTAEIVGLESRSRHIGILGTPGTVSSGSYLLEIEKFFPDIKVYQEACPMWVPLIENGEADTPAADYFIRRHVENLIQKQPAIDTIILACTHYPLIIDKIKMYLPAGVKVVSQGPIVADSLRNYLERHPEMDAQCSKGGTVKFCTTDETAAFDTAASYFYNGQVTSLHVTL
jgi:glutamate racemase